MIACRSAAAAVATDRAVLPWQHPEFPVRVWVGVAGAAVHGHLIVSKVRPQDADPWLWATADRPLCRDPRLGAAIFQPARGLPSCVGCLRMARWLLSHVQRSD